MLNFFRIFGSFSRRELASQREMAPLTPECRNRILMLCRDTFSGANHTYLAEDAMSTFLGEIHQGLTYLYGKPRLADSSEYSKPAEDVIAFLMTCSDEHFLDFVELLFDVECYRRMCPDENALVDQINHFFNIDNVPYWVTKFVREERRSDNPMRPAKTFALTARPKVIRKDDEIVHQQAIQPCLVLLAQPQFKAANSEFLEALTDFRRGDSGDCLVKCGSAIESTLKVVHDRNRWPYSDTDTVAPLLKRAIKNAGIESFFEQPLLLVGTMRNKLSTAHGGGSDPRQVNQATARFAVNATASAILFIEERCP